MVIFSKNLKQLLHSARAAQSAT
jgi:hypothetical protein